MILDPVAVHNERVKLLAGFFNALGLAVIGLGALAPAVAVLGPLSGVAASTPSLNLPLVAISAGVGVASHVVAHYILGQLRKAPPDDPERG